MITIKSIDPSELICLQEVGKVEKGHPLSHLYENESKTNDKDRAQVSVLASIVHQKRAYFAMTRERFFELCRNDPNWKSQIRLGNSAYSAVRRALYDGFIQEYKKGVGKRPTCFKVVSPDLLGILNLSTSEIEMQRNEVDRYWNRDSLIRDGK